LLARQLPCSLPVPVHSKYYIILLPFVYVALRLCVIMCLWPSAFLFCLASVCLPLLAIARPAVGHFAFLPRRFSFVSRRRRQSVVPQPAEAFAPSSFPFASSPFLLVVSSFPSLSLSFSLPHLSLTLTLNLGPGFHLADSTPHAAAIHQHSGYVWNDLTNVNPRT
jgi:hypothetical protein